jgi:HAD superfamily hydrolase (TIGR01509 family)
MGKPVSVVCFDLGGVLVRICRTFTEACRAAGVPLRASEQIQSEPWLARRRALQDQHQSGQISSEDFYQQAAVALEHTYSAQEVERIHQAWVLDEFDGVVQLVEALQRNSQLRTACLSNINDAHWKLIRGERAPSKYPGVMKLQQHLLSHEMGEVKPNPEIYRLATESLGVPPDSVVFFDDLIENVTAARGFGWRAFHIDHTSDTPLQIRQSLATLGIPLG